MGAQQLLVQNKFFQVVGYFRWNQTLLEGCQKIPSPLPLRRHDSAASQKGERVRVRGLRPAGSTSSGLGQTRGPLTALSPAEGERENGSPPPRLTGIRDR